MLTRSLLLQRRAFHCARALADWDSLAHLFPSVIPSCIRTSYSNVVSSAHPPLP
ncbi:hypothetical protein CERSUDRAFT_101333 [Gelatoporia subvermispora B]|uniref:Uncharacterized protein n=1 Tax=Ceriporiopsis subvermispora (strain B) TaxID=914234 RepID=M2QEQ1_CERS8|nr:hypothetical protein CERSUDRAFT_101333 [Gelatoporia subvermispora B]